MGAFFRRELFHGSFEVKKKVPGKKTVIAENGEEITIESEVETELNLERIKKKL